MRKGLVISSIIGAILKISSINLKAPIKNGEENLNIYLV